MPPPSISPFSTTYYYEWMNGLVRERLGARHSAHCLVHAVDFAGVEAMREAGGNYTDLRPIAMRGTRLALADGFAWKQGEPDLPFDLGNASKYVQHQATVWGSGVERHIQDAKGRPLRFHLL